MPKVPARALRQSGPRVCAFPATAVCFLLVGCAFKLHFNRNKLCSLHLSVLIYVLQFELIIFCAYPLLVILDAKTNLKPQ